MSDNFEYMRIQGLDNLRFTLALLVVFSHLLFWYHQAHLDTNYEIILYFNALFRTGGEIHPAVLLFITLSGYCIHDSFDGNLTSFIKRRTYRIIPLFFIGTFFGAMVFEVFRTPTIENILETQEITPKLLFLKLLGAQAFSSDLFEPTYQGNAALSTVAVEIWLYAFYPIGLIILTKLGTLRFSISLLFVAIIGSLMVAYNMDLRPWWNNGSFLGFLPYWWIGVLFHNQRFKQIANNMLPFLILSFFVLTLMILINNLNPVTIECRKLCLAMLGGLLITKLDKIRTTQIVWYSSLTKCSYSIYALHTPIICICIYYTIPMQITFLAVLIVAYCSYLMIERPLYKRPKYEDLDTKQLFC